MLKQLGLFDSPPRPIEPRDPTVPAAAKTRMSRQCRLILRRLREGPATNAELAAISLKYGGRTSDLRKAGYVITCFDHDRKTGTASYRLDYEPAGAI